MTQFHTYEYKTGQKGRGKHPLILMQWTLAEGDSYSSPYWGFGLWPIVVTGPGHYWKIETYLAFCIDGEEQWRINANETYEQALERWGKHAR